MSLSRRAFESVEIFRRYLFGVDGGPLNKDRARNSVDKKRHAPKPSLLRLENLEDRALLSVAPPFAVSLAGQTAAPAVLEYSGAESVLSVPELANALAVAPLRTQASRDADDLAVVIACGLDPDNTNYVKWNSNGRMSYLNCNGSNITALDLTGCTELEYACVSYCTNLNSLSLSGLQSLDNVEIHDNANLKDLNLDNIKVDNYIYVYSNYVLMDIAFTSLNVNIFSCYNNASLSSFSAMNCQASYLGVFANPLLTQIDLTDSSVCFEISNCDGITNLDVATFLSVRKITVHDMLITSLDFSDLQTLEDVEIYNCSNLTNLDLSGLQSLANVTIHGNMNLTDLNLDNINVNNNVRIYNNEALTDIAVAGMCTKTFYCSENVSLVSFSATNCKSSYGFELQFNPMLTQIDLVNSDISLTICFCDGITTLDLVSFSSLRNLNISNCANLKVLDLSGLQSLSSVQVSYNPSLTNLNLNNIRANSNVYVGSNNSLTNLAITGMNVTEFICYDNASLSSFSAINCQTNGWLQLSVNPLLTQIDLTNSCVDFVLTGCESITTLDVTSLSAVRSIYISNVPIKSLHLSGLQSLVNVDIHNCENLTNLSIFDTQASGGVSVSNNANLIDLNLDNTKGNSVSVFNNAALTELSVTGLKGNSVSVFNNVALTDLSVTGLNVSDSFVCFGNTLLSSFSARNCQTGRLLQLRNNPVLTQIDLLGSSVNLAISNCDSLTSLDSTSLTSVKSIQLSNTSITSLDLSGIQSIEEIRVCNNTNLTSLDISGLQSLGWVVVDDNASLIDLNLDNLKSNDTVNIRNNSSLTNLTITDLNALSFLCSKNASLSNFSASNCQTSDAFQLSGNPILKQVNLSNNPLQKQFVISGNAIETLNFTGCSELTYLYCGEDALETLYVSQESSFDLHIPKTNSWSSLTIRDGFGDEIVTTDRYYYFNPGSYNSSPITMDFYEEGTTMPIRTTAIWKGSPSLTFNQYSKTVTALVDQNVVLTRGVTATGIENPTYTVKIDGVKSTKITVNKTWGQIVYSGGVNGMPARSEPYVVTITAADQYGSVSKDFLLTVANDSRISTTVSTNSPKYNTAVRATLKPTAATVTYQWYRTKNAADATAVWTAISGATKATYVPTDADLGYYLKVVARGTGDYAGHATQAITTGKATRAIVSVTLPTTVEVNKTLTAYLSPSAATATYQWYRGSDADGWTAIKNATGVKYVPQLADVGKYLKVVATGKDNYTGSASKVTSKPVTASLVSVSFSGKLRVGSTVTSYLSPSAATVTYQWYSSSNGSSWTEITDATSKSYTPTDAEAGKYLRVVIKGTGFYKGTLSKTTASKISAVASTPSAQDAFIGYEDAVLDEEFGEFWNTLEETLNN